MCKSILISEVIRDRDGGVRGRQFKQRHTDKFTGNVGAVVKNSDFYMGKSDNYLNKDRDRDRGGGGRKTPFEIFLEDDGPYSRKLYGPLSDSTKTKTGDRVTHSSRNISSSKSTEYLDNTQDFVERDLRSISAIKKGLLWQQRDKLFSRSVKIFF